MFVDREIELEALNRLLPGASAQLVVLYGRRVGKTALLLEWARRSGLPYLYWVAIREPTLLLPGAL